LSAHSIAGVPVAALPSEQVPGAFPSAHVGKLPLAHCLAPLSTVLVSTYFEISTPPAQVKGFLPSEHVGAADLAIEALLMIGLVPSEHFG
jgi:hypothetical protein